MTDPLGRTLGPYTITERLGRGGMADVYKAFHAGLSTHRAIKVIRPDLAGGQDFRARFQKEAQAVASLRHPNIVQVHDFGSDDGNYYMVMEFIDGQDLRKVIRTEGAMHSVTRAVDIVAQLADALEYAHARNVIHRDVKPENVMLNRDGTPVLMDFGIARLLTGATRLTQTGSGMGTPAYMAPEQALGADTVGPAADVYALSIVLFELLTGRVPYSADTPVAVIMKAINDPLPLPRQLRADLSEDVQAVVLKGTQKRPEDRYPSAAAMRDALRATIGAAASPPGPTLLSQRASDRSCTASRRWGSYAYGAIGVVAVAAGLWIFSLQPTPVAPPGQAPVVEPSQPPDAAPAAALDASADSAPTSATSTGSSPGSARAPEVPLAAPISAVSRSAPPVNLTIQATVGAAPSKRTEHAGDDVGVGITAAKVSSTDLARPPATAVVARIGDDSHVLRGVTTQRDMLRLFGGPDIATRDRAGRDVWVYQQSESGTQSTVASGAVEKKARLGLFFGGFGAGASGTRQDTNVSSYVSQQIRTLTVTVTFGADRTVADYQVESTHF